MKNIPHASPRFLSNIRVGHRLLILTLAFMVWGLVGSLLAYKTLKEVQINGPLYQRLVEGKDLVADILPPPKYIVESNLLVHEMVLSETPDDIPALENRLQQLQAEYMTRHAVWNTSQLEGALHQAMQVQSYEPAQQFFKTAFESLIPALKAGDRVAAKAFLASMQQDYAKHRQAIDATVKLAAQRNTSVEEEARQTLADEVLLWLMVAGAMTVLVFGLGFALARGITQPLSQSLRAVQSIAAGDLTQPIPAGGKDEIGQLLAAMAEMQARLRELVGHIQLEAHQLADSAQVLNAVTTTVANATVSQSEAAAGMAASVEQLSVSIDHVGANARDAEAVAQQSGHQSRTGGEVIKTAAEEMRVIADAVNTSAGTIGELEGYSNEISTVVAVIKDIADQTNLLALNAAIEAARAGEQGRGFAVVADEVRKLAERTTQSTLLISATINKVQESARQAVSAMQAGVVRVNEGVQTAHHAGESINDIQTSAKHVVEVIQDIALTLNEQSASAQSIAKGVEKIAQMAEMNSASVSQTVAAVQQMQDLASNLTHSVQRFRT